MEEDIERPPSSADLVQAARDAFASDAETADESVVREARRAVEPPAPGTASQRPPVEDVERPPSSADLVQAARDAWTTSAEPASEAAVREARATLEPPTPGEADDGRVRSDARAVSPARAEPRESAVPSIPGGRRSPPRRPRRESTTGPVEERRSARAALLGGLALLGSLVAVIAGLVSEGDSASPGPSAVTTITSVPVTTTRAPATTAAPATTTSTAPASTAWEIADPGELTLVGTATAIDAGIRLTTESRRLQAGAAWLPTKQPVADGFTTTFAFQLTDREVNPGDGFAFVIQNAGGSSLPPDSAASGIGYKGLPNSVAVEFDTTYQGYETDPRGNHIAVHTRGTAANTTHRKALVGSVSPSGMRWHDVVHTVRIDYTPGTLAIFLDDTEEAILQVDLDLATRLRLDDGAAWLGFTASTEPGFTDVHDILGWSFEPAQEG